MSRIVTLADFPGVSREDSVTVVQGSASSPAAIEFTLASAPGVTSWKGLRLVSPDGAVVDSTSTGDADHGPTAVLSLPSNQAGTVRLRLFKAKLFGIHTGMYELELTGQAGNRLDLEWTRDKHSGGRFLGFVQDLGTAIADISHVVAQAVEDVTGAVAEAVADAVETVGNLIGDGLDALAGLLRKVPGVGIVLYGIFHWIAGVVSACFDFAGAVVKAVLNVAADVVAGALRVGLGGLGGLMSWDGTVFVRGLKDFVAGVVGAFLTTALKGIAAAQSLFGLQWRKRALTTAERALLFQVFRRSLSYYNVRVVLGFGGVFSINDRAVTVGNTIYMKHNNPATASDVLVHEFTHVWQYQHAGSRYISEAAGAQAFVSNEYSWRAELGRGDQRWTVFNREAQASFVEDVWTEGQQTAASPLGNGGFYVDQPVGATTLFTDSSSGDDRTFLARESVHTLRDPWTWRISTLIDRI
ncbi:DUF4157 domain-containing protein [Hamadaea sp. NPDC051192]|uniref:eCIS core domain-containing protein n=1 Tax=Hamadaea sp. NPDC051192 TaxID=3154940 RepID=UPI00342D8747